MNISELQTKIALLKGKYTFEQDNQMVYAWEKSVREMAVRLDLKKMDGIKEFLAEIENMIKEMSILLSWSKDLTEDERKRVFNRREIYMWVYSFFDDPNKIVESISVAVEKEINT